MIWRIWYDHQHKNLNCEIRVKIAIKYKDVHFHWINIITKYKKKLGKYIKYAVEIEVNFKYLISQRLWDDLTILEWVWILHDHKSRCICTRNCVCFFRVSEYSYMYASLRYIVSYIIVRKKPHRSQCFTVYRGKKTACILQCTLSDTCGVLGDEYHE